MDRNLYKTTSEKPKENTYYCFVNAIESNAEGQLIIELDSIGKRWMSQIGLQENQNLFEIGQQIPSSIFVITASQTDVISYIDFQVENIELLQDTWVKIEIDEQQGLSADYFEEDASYTTRSIISYINKIIQIDENELSVIKTNFNLNKLPNNQIKTSEEIEKLLAKSLRNLSPEFVTSYGVGQGSANAICNMNGYPLLYFDLGGGFGANWRTYLKTKRFVIPASRVVLLSHWDCDHFESARRNTNSDFLDRVTWIAPYQTQLGAIHINFINLLGGNLLILRAGYGSIRTSFGQIIECTGPITNKNNYGLAFFTSISTRKNSINKVLLPGDAAYTHLSVLPQDANGLVATHHGANFDHPNIVPVANGSKKAIVYSFGLGNIWDHPRRKTSMDVHLHAGWENRKSAIHNNVGFHDITHWRSHCCLYYYKFPRRLLSHFKDMCIEQDFS